jgi:Kip1 ubiquitination-promoting complex protein 1
MGLKGNGLALLLAQDSEEDSSAMKLLCGTKTRTQEEMLKEALEYVFDLGGEGASGAGEEAGPTQLSEAEPLISARVASFQEGVQAMTAPAKGRLGPSTVRFDEASVSGQVKLSADGLVVESLSNFSSARATVCVFAGKWMYEATIYTSGIQQIGWATLKCPFTSEEGVGDAPDSYAFDGKRMRKWSVRDASYGQAWATGDVIGVYIDLDIGDVSFSRNGTHLGVAFSGVRTMNPTAAYFPAVSLSHAERVSLNFVCFNSISHGL